MKGKTGARILGLLMLLAPAVSSRADVVYSGLVNLAIPTDFEGVYLDMDTGATSNAEFAGWDVNAFFGGFAVANSPAFQPVRTAMGNSDSIARLGVGALVDGGGPYSTGYGGSSTHLGNGAGQFAPGQEGYLGFKFQPNAGGGDQFGWIRAVFTAGATGGVLKDWAYDTSGAAIRTGRIEQGAAVHGVQTLTLSGGAGEAYTLSGPVSNPPANSAALVKTGAGKWTLKGSSDYAGSTTVSGGILEVGPGASLGQTSGLTVSTGGSLLLSGAGGSESKLNSAATLKLDGGMLDLGELTSHLDQHLGAVSLNDDSVLDLGTLGAGHALRLADSSASTWGSGDVLSIWNWTRGTDHLFFGTSSQGLTAAQLSSVRLFSDSGATSYGPVKLLETGELVAVPEMESWFSVAALLGWVGMRELRRRRFGLG